MSRTWVLVALTDANGAGTLGAALIRRSEARHPELLAAGGLQRLLAVARLPAKANSLPKSSSSQLQAGDPPGPVIDTPIFNGGGSPHGGARVTQQCSLNLEDTGAPMWFVACLVSR